MSRNKTDYEKLFETFLFNLEHDKKFREYYYYILGLYLGDGCINAVSRTYALKICCSRTQDKVMNDCINAMKYILPNKISIVYTKAEMNIIQIHSKLIPYIFPQIGPGKKYSRDVSLCDWQLKYIVWESVLIGLFHSDGSIYKDGKYVRFTFVNVSIDICEIMKRCLEHVNIHYTTYISKSRGYGHHDVTKIVVNDQHEMVKLYKIIGEKYEISRLNYGHDIKVTQNKRIYK